MKLYKAEPNADLEFSFPDELDWEELDRQGVKLPVQMKFVDLVIERDNDILLVEIKDPSNKSVPVEERQNYFKRLSDNSILSQELTPKARGSYTFLHLMERDAKPFKYVVLLGLDAFNPEPTEGTSHRIQGSAPGRHPMRDGHALEASTHCGLRRAFRGHLEQDICRLARGSGSHSGRRWGASRLMDTTKLKKFAQFARRTLMGQVSAKLDSVLAEGAAARREHPEAMKKLEAAIARDGKGQVIERVAYIWFNRFSALRFMDVNDLNPVRDRLAFVRSIPARNPG